MTYALVIVLLNTYLISTSFSRLFIKWKPGVLIETMTAEVDLKRTSHEF